MGASVSGAATASFSYDADGKQVIGTVNGVTTYYVGNHYEVKNSVVTKYYFAGATRLAVRTGGTLSFLLADHIGSSSVTTDANGGNLSKGLQKGVGSTYPQLLHGRNGDVIYYGSSGNGPGATGWPEPDYRWDTWDEVSKWNVKEDFAQSFAAYIYPGVAEKKLSNYGDTYGSGNSYYDTSRGQYIGSIIP